MLAAAVHDAGGTPVDLGISDDSRATLRRLASQGLECDVLVISGGVSMGVLDLVPAVLAELGVEQVFHKVHFKPGKPIWFGRLPRPGGDCLVFGLPGNPVSSLVSFELFVRPALSRLAGREHSAQTKISARLARPFSHRGDRPTYHPAIVDRDAAEPTVDPVEWHGSADIRGFARGTALAVFPAGEREYAAGEWIEVLVSHR
jgi:molybdopterin molybdotransferase